jgi:hypothetical protein
MTEHLNRSTSVQMAVIKKRVETLARAVTTPPGEARS